MAQYGSFGAQGAAKHFGSAETKDDEEDDLYGGFNYSINVNPAVPSTAAGFGEFGSFNPGAGFGAPFNPMQVPPTALRAPPTQLGRLTTSRMTTARMMTAAQGPAGEARPMTSVHGAGYNSAARQPKRPFDPLNQGGRGPAPPLAKKSDNSPEDQAAEMEKQVNRLIEQSADAAARGDYAVALERAKEAGKKERQLCKHREQFNLVDQINLDLTYAVCFNLAHAYHLNKMYDEALNTYSLVVKNKQYPQAGRLRVNMGNIYFEQKKYSSAVKLYRMALDQIPNTGSDMRLKILRNIGNALVRLGQFQEAIQSYETVLDGLSDFQTGFNLVVCHFALGQKDKMKRAFTRLLSIPVVGMTEEDEEEEEEEEEDAEGKHDDVLRRPDALKEELRERQKQATQYISQAAQLIAPVVEDEWHRGFDWVIQSLRGEHEKVASEMEIQKAITFLKTKQFPQAIEVLKGFERKENALKARAATNLSFLYFLEGDYAQADKYADLAVRNDRYNAKALVNKGNCLFMREEYERAKELYLEAIGVEADCVEAIYNLGLVNRRLGTVDEALQAFEKLHSIIPNSPEVMYQIANLYDITGKYRTALKWFNLLTSRLPSDPGVLARMGQMLNKDEDDGQAFHYHMESYRYYPVNLDVISWLGVWFVKSELYEKAIAFFERAAQIQPQEVKWRLMVASCYRRMGAYQKAVELYERIHRDSPENLECLRYLVAICKDLGLNCEEYQAKLTRLERAAAKVQAGAAVTTFAGAGAYAGGSVPLGARHADDTEPLSAADSPPRMPAPSVPVAVTSTPGRMAEESAEQDEFEDADVGELLA